MARKICVQQEEFLVGQYVNEIAPHGSDICKHQSEDLTLDPSVIKEIHHYRPRQSCHRAIE